MNTLHQHNMHNVIHDIMKPQLNKTDSGQLRDIHSCLVTDHVWLQAVLRNVECSFNNIKGCGCRWGCMEVLY